MSGFDPGLDVPGFEPGFEVPGFDPGLLVPGLVDPPLGDPGVVGVLFGFVPGVVLLGEVLGGWVVLFGVFGLVGFEPGAVLLDCDPVGGAVVLPVGGCPVFPVGGAPGEV